jgi:hypothetical protein
MPRYNYECELCGISAGYHLRLDQEPEKCISCNTSGSLSRIFSRNTFTVLNNKQQVKGEQPAGILTKEYIEENRKILEEQKTEATSEEYEPS